MTQTHKISKKVLIQVGQDNNCHYPHFALIKINFTTLNLMSRVLNSFRSWLSKFLSDKEINFQYMKGGLI